MGNRKAELLVLARLKSKDARNADISINKPNIQKLIGDSSDEEYDSLVKIIDRVEGAAAIKRWAKSHSARDLSDLTLAELRDKAVIYSIEHPYSKTQMQLLKEVQHAIKSTRRED